MENINLIAKNNINSPLAEAYRELRTNIQFVCDGNAMKTIAFVSTLPNEGKSTTVSNVAIAMAQIGKRTLLIDCDLRKPTQHKLFKIPNHGLNDYIVSGKEWANITQKDIITNLDIIPSGAITPDPLNILQSDKMDKILTMMREKYDYIFLDLPPVLVASDAAIIASKADAAILVISSGEVSPNELKNTTKRLFQCEANVVGTILNKAPMQEKYGYYGYNYRGKI